MKNHRAKSGETGFLTTNAGLTCYDRQGEYKKALKYYHQSFSMRRELGLREYENLKLVLTDKNRQSPTQA